MPAMAQAAEAISKAVGAPFLRSDFFVGSEKWGVRLNEVAYGSGVECRRKGISAVSGSLDDRGIDDLPVIARILQEGFSRCTKKKTARNFLEPLGAVGETYEVLKVKRPKVVPLALRAARSQLPKPALKAFEKVWKAVPSEVAQLVPGAARSQVSLPNAAIEAFDNAAQLQFTPIGKEDCETTKAGPARPVLAQPWMPHGPTMAMPAGGKPISTFGHIPNS